MSKLDTSILLKIVSNFSMYFVMINSLLLLLLSESDCVNLILCIMPRKRTNHLYPLWSFPAKRTLEICSDGKCLFFY